MEEQRIEWNFLIKLILNNYPLAGQQIMIENESQYEPSLRKNELLKVIEGITVIDKEVIGEDEYDGLLLIKLIIAAYFMNKNLQRFLKRGSSE